MTTASDGIERQVVEIFASLTQRDPATIGFGDTMEALGVDSLSMVEGIFAIEETFDVSVPFNANDPGAAPVDLSTVGSVVEAVRTLLSQKAA